jgi:hypothetical protein
MLQCTRILPRRGNEVVLLRVSFERNPRDDGICVSAAIACNEGGAIPELLPPVSTNSIEVVCAVKSTADIVTGIKLDRGAGSRS